MDQSGVGSPGFEPPEGVQTDVAFEESTDMDFRKGLLDAVKFPVTALGECYEGAPKVGQALQDQGFKIKYAYDPTTAGGRGHVWVMAQNPKDKKYQAVDAHYGPILHDDTFYKAPYTFDDWAKMDELIPTVTIKGGDEMANKFVDKPWNGGASRFDDAQWDRSCLVDLNPEGKDIRGNKKLPIREPDGTFNVSAIRNALAQLPKTDGNFDHEKIKARLDSLLSEFNASKNVEKASQYVSIRINNTEKPVSPDNATSDVNGSISLFFPRSMFSNIPFDEFEVEDPQKFAQFGQAIIDAVTGVVKGETHSRPFLDAFHEHMKSNPLLPQHLYDSAFTYARAKAGGIMSGQSRSAQVLDPLSPEGANAGDEAGMIDEGACDGGSVKACGDKVNKLILIDILKFDPSSKLIYGIVLKANTPDLQGDIMSPEDIREAMITYAKDYRVISVDHKQDVEKAYPVFIWQALEKGNLFGREYGPGDWLMATLVEDPTITKGIEAGVYRSYSIEGIGYRTPIEGT